MKRKGFNEQKNKSIDEHKNNLYDYYIKYLYLISGFGFLKLGF